MKYFVIFILFSCFVILGFRIGDYYRKRVQFYDDLILYMETNILAVNYTNQTLKNIINENCDSFSGDFRGVIDKFVAVLNNLCTNENFRQSLDKIKYLSCEEKDEISNFFFHLGDVDCENEVAKLKNCKSKMEIKKQKLENSKNIYSPLYIKLGIVFGLLGVLIFL